MGYRLEGPVLQAAATHTASAPSEATFPGALQIPPNGRPIVLMADRQTTGGYPVLAIVASADLGLTAQLAPGDIVRFELCSLQDAVSSLVAQEALLIGVEGGEVA